jgi:hypothetical protein
MSNMSWDIQKISMGKYGKFYHELSKEEKDIVFNYYYDYC